MANEITMTANLTASKGGATIASGSKTKSISMTGANMISATQDIGTSSELVSFGDISGAPAQVRITNLDDTNYIELGGDSGLTVFKIQLNAGEVCLFRPSSGTLYAKANTAAVRILKDAVEA